MNLKDKDVMLATWFGSGLAPKAPGTWGSLAAIPFALIIIYFGGHSALVFGCIFVSALGYYATKAFQKRYNVADDQRIVIDEVAGQWIALLGASLNPLHILLAFALFRTFDIIKPWPCSSLEKLADPAAGVMADDIAAGIYALLCLIGLRYAGLG